MSEFTSLPNASPLEPGQDDQSSVPDPSHPQQPLSSTSAAAAGTLDSSDAFKVRKNSASIKRHLHEDTHPAPTVPHSGALPTDASPPSSVSGDPHKRQKTGDSNGHSSSVASPASSGSPASSQPSTRPGSPSHSRRGSMTEDQKRSSFALALARALASDASSPASPSTPPSRPSSPAALPPEAIAKAKAIEAAVYGQHGGLTVEYTTALRALAGNLRSSGPIMKERILAGEVDVEDVSALSWKDVEDDARREEREEAKHEDLIDHLAPVDVIPGILPNANTTDN